MCLVNFVRDKNITQGKTRRVYKVVARRSLKNHLTSPFETHYSWNVGVNQSSRLDTKLTQEEILDGEIKLGLHVFLTKKEAETYLNEFAYFVDVDNLTVLACKADPKDYVVSGEWDGDDDKIIHNAVYTKLRVEKREIERAYRRDYSI